MKKRNLTFSFAPLGRDCCKGRGLMKRHPSLRSVRNVLFLSLFASNVQAQVASGELLERFEQRFNQLDSLIFRQPSIIGSGAEKAVSLPADLVLDASRLCPDSLINNKVDAEIRAFKGRTGLQLSGQTYYRPDEEIGIDDEDEAVSRYKTKVQAEVRWYFLQSSLFKRKGQINEFRIKGEMERLSRQQENMGVLHARQQEIFQQRYDSLLYSVLRHRVTNLALLSETQLYLLERENISSDELLNILNEKAEAERLLASISKTYTISHALPSVVGLFIHIDAPRYMEEMGRQHAGLHLLELEQELLEQQRRNTSYWNDFRVAPFIRYSHYTRSVLSNSQNVDVGLSFIVPLAAETPRKRKVLKAEQMLLASRQETALTKIKEEVGLIIEDVERNNRLMKGELVRMKELEKYLQMRTEAYENRKGEYSRLSRIKEYNTYLKCRESLLRYQYLRDMRLADLQAFLGNTPIQDFCQVTYQEY